MKKAIINWNKIIANAGLVFFSTMSAAIATGTTNALEIALMVATIQAGVAFFSEMKLESEGNSINLVQSVAKKAVLF